MSGDRGDAGSHRKPFFYGWVIALCCTLVTIINGGIFFSFSVFFKPVAFDFGWSRGGFSTAFTAMLVAYAPGAFFSGRLADRHGPRGVLLLAALLIGLGFIGCSRATNLVFMTLSYAMIGLGTGATLALPTATIQRWFVKWRGPMVGVVVAGTGIGAFIFAPLINSLIALYSWRTAYLVIAIIFGTVIAVSASFLVSEPKAKRLRPYGDEGQLQGADSRLQAVPVTSLTSAQAFKTSAFWGLAAVSILGFMPSFFINAHLVPYATDRGISATVGARALGMMGILSAAGRLVMTGVAERAGWMKTLATCFVITVLSTIWLAFVTGPGELYLFVIVYGFFWGSILALFGGAVNSFFGLAALSELLGFLLGLAVLMGAVAPLLGGLSFDLTGSYLLAVAFSAVAFVAAALLCFLLKPPPR